MRAGGQAGEDIVYAEQTRSFRLVWLLAALIGAGAAVAGGLGAGVAAVVALAGACVLVAAAAAITGWRARRTPEITVTLAELVAGRQRIDRDLIARALDSVPSGARVLGLRRGGELPRGVAGLTLQLANDNIVVVPAAHPDRLAAALALDGRIPPIRAADPHELLQLAEIEVRADELYAAAGIGPLPGLADPPEDGGRPGVVLVAGRPGLGFVRVGVIDGRAHLEQLSVLPAVMRRGIGSALLSAALDWARAAGYPAMTVTTFADVPWNAPFLATRGFTPLTDVSPGLAELRDWERDLGLDHLGRRIVLCIRLEHSQE